MHRDQDRCKGGGGLLLELHMIDPYSNVGIPCVILCTACECHSLIALLVHSAVTHILTENSCAAMKETSESVSAPCRSDCLGMCQCPLSPVCATGGVGGRGEMVPFLFIENTSYEFCAVMVTLLNGVVLLLFTCWDQDRWMWSIFIPSKNKITIA